MTGGAGRGVRADGAPPDRTARQRDGLRRRALLALLPFALLYGVAARRQSFDVFMEAEFLHIPFLRSLAEGRPSLPAVLTTFGEHLFPGTNLLLIPDYYLFGISGHYTTAVAALAVLAAAVVLAGVVARLWRGGPVSLTLCIATLGAVLLSPVNAPMWGMALAAQWGVVLTVIAMGALAGRSGAGRMSLWPAALAPPAILLFLGGYAVGFIAAMLSGALLWGLNHRTWRRPAILAATLALSAALYVAIVSAAVPLFANAPRGGAAALPAMLDFGLVLGGASLLGTGFHALHPSFLAYRAAGLLLFALAALALGATVSRFRRGTAEPLDLFVLLLLVYALSIIAVVSVFRVANGPEGATGNWYVAHTKLLPAALVIWLWQRLEHPASRPLRAAWAGLALAAVLLFAAAGLRGDWIKAPYVRDWKAAIAGHALDLISRPPGPDSAERSETLLWPAEVSKPGVEFLYRAGLWRFRGHPVLVEGLTADGWLVAGRDVLIACPPGAPALEVAVTRPPGWPPARLRVTPRDGAPAELSVDGAAWTIPFAGPLAIARFSAQGDRAAPPVSPPGDPRALVARIGPPSCSPPPRTRAP